MIEPDLGEVLRAYAAMRQRHAASQASSALLMEQESRHWETRPLLERRIQWGAAGCPRFLYKYRGRVDDEEGMRRSSDVLLRHQLWLADASKYEDPQDSRVDYRTTLTGEALREEMVAFVRRATRANRFKAERMVSDRVLSDPEGLMAQMNADAEMTLRGWGICSLAANARSDRMWREYSHDHHGVCFQFLPAADVGAFVNVQPVTYSDEERMIEDRFFGEQLNQRRLDLLNTKRTKYQFEDEWRIISAGRANAPHPFKPEALTAVILGAWSEASQPIVARLLRERRRQTGLYLPVYQARLDGSVVRIDRLQSDVEAGRDG